jgi:hypothetical protein
MTLGRAGYEKELRRLKGTTNAKAGSQEPTSKQCRDLGQEALPRAGVGWRWTSSIGHWKKKYW